MRVQKHVLATVPQLDLASGAQTGQPEQPPWEQQPLQRTLACGCIPDGSRPVFRTLDLC